MRRALLAAAAALALLALPAVAHATPPPLTWCGHDESAANRTPDVELSSWAQIRMVYAIPADGADNFSFVASGMARDAAWIDEWWQRQDPSRTPRFDRYPFPGCTTKFADLDIGFIRLPHPGSFYVSDQYALLTQDLKDAFPNGQKTIVYYEGPVQDADVCGISPSSYKEYGGWAGIAYVFLGSACELRPPGSGTSAQVAAHELLHNLGATPPEAPNRCADSAHPCDSATDVLYPYVGRASSLEVVTLDYGRDDYYGHGGAWWDVQDAWWLEHLPQAPLSLTVAGSGTVKLDLLDQDLPCAAGCSGVMLDSDSAIDGLAIPARGWRVGSWSGACTSTAALCQFVTNGPTSLAVTFVPAGVDVSVRVRGKGRVTSAPAGLACAGLCTHSFKAGTTVRLRAVAAKGWRFAGWSVDCRGRRACTIGGEGGDVIARFVRQ